jgi:hypothetical protein
MFSAYGDHSLADLELLAQLDPFNLAIADVHDAVGAQEHLVVVRRGDDGHAALHAQALQELDDLAAGLQVQEQADSLPEALRSEPGAGRMLRGERAEGGAAAWLAERASPPGGEGAE